MSLVMVSGVPGNFLNGPHKQQALRLPTDDCCGDFFGVYIKSSSFSLQGFRRRAILVFNDTKSGGEKLETLQTVVARYWWKRRIDKNVQDNEKN